MEELNRLECQLGAKELARKSGRTKMGWVGGYAGVVFGASRIPDTMRKYALVERRLKY